MDKAMDIDLYNEIFHPSKWGEVVSLETSYQLLDKDGKLVDERKWKSQSYVRWMGRLIEIMFSGSAGGASNQLTASDGTVFTPQWAAIQGGQGDARFVPRPNETFVGGAMMGIGTGALTGADSSFFNLKTPFGATPYDALYSAFTTQEDTTAIEFAVQHGITNNSNASITVTEQALFGRCRASTNDGTTFLNQPAHAVMFAYDEISPGVVVTIGQTFVPRYTLRYQA